MSSSRSLAVVILAAGQGTRMKSATPKVLHRLAGHPLIGHVLHTARSLEPDVTLAVVRHERDRVAETVLQYDERAIIVDQDELPGTGRAVELAASALPEGFDGDLVVLSADVPLLDADTVRALIAAHREAANQMTILSAIFDDPTGFGRIVRDADGAFAAIVEQKDATPEELEIAEINAGVYVFDTAVLRATLTRIGLDNAQGEKYLTDAARLIRADGGRIDAMPVDDTWLVQGINDRVQLGRVARELNNRILERHMRAGVTIVDPLSTWIDQEVSIGEDTVIHPGTQLLGATSIAGSVELGPDTTIRDTSIEEGARVVRSDVTLSEIGAGATVGPWSYLRPNSVLGAGSKVGTFVETKNTQLGAGSKVPHLSYIGDTEIGAATNVGAGAITANYDGHDKHRTTIGDHVHTGAGTVFVAPVTVGDGSYTAANTTVRKNVPAGALALNVAPQRNSLDWTLSRWPGTPEAEAAERAASGEGQRERSGAEREAARSDAEGEDGRSAAEGQGERSGAAGGDGDAAASSREIPAPGDDAAPYPRPSRD